MDQPRSSTWTSRKRSSPGSGGKHIPSRQSKLGQVHLLFPEYRPLLPKGKGSPLEPVGDPLAGELHDTFFQRPQGQKRGILVRLGEEPGTLFLGTDTVYKVPGHWPGAFHICPHRGPAHRATDHPPAMAQAEVDRATGKIGFPLRGARHLQRTGFHHTILLPQCPPEQLVCQSPLISQLLPAAGKSFLIGSRIQHRLSPPFHCESLSHPPKAAHPPHLRWARRASGLRAA